MRRTRAVTAVPHQDPTSKRWGFVLDLPPGPDGRRRQMRRKGYQTKDQAQAELTKLRRSLLDGTHVETSTLTVGVFLNDEWLPAKQGSLGRSTWASYADKVRLYVVPAIGHVKLQALTTSQVNQLYSAMAAGGRRDGKAEGYSPRTIRYAHTILRAALQDAVKWGLLVRNVADVAEVPRTVDARPPEMKTWTATQLETFLSAEHGNRYYPLWSFMALTGCRRGEALGQRWGDLDLADRRASIRQTIGTVNHRIVVSPRPKSGRAKVIDLDARTASTLATWRKRQHEERLALGESYDNHDLVFTLPDGRPYNPDRVSREFDRRIARHGLQRIRLHDLRHTWATLALQAGIHPKVVQERLGHSSIAITLDLCDPPHADRRR